MEVFEYAEDATKTEMIKEILMSRHVSVDSVQMPDSNIMVIIKALDVAAKGRTLLLMDELAEGAWEIYASYDENADRKAFERAKKFWLRLFKGTLTEDKRRKIIGNPIIELANQPLRTHFTMILLMFYTYTKFLAFLRNFELGCYIKDNDIAVRLNEMAKIGTMMDGFLAGFTNLFARVALRWNYQSCDDTLSKVADITYHELSYGPLGHLATGTFFILLAIAVPQAVATLVRFPYAKMTEFLNVVFAIFDEAGVRQIEPRGRSPKRALPAPEVDCAVCSSVATAKCCSTFYCSEKCQKIDWQSHKLECNKTQI